jgi:hypothetical protein
MNDKKVTELHMRLDFSEPDVAARGLSIHIGTVGASVHRLSDDKCIYVHTFEECVKWALGQPIVEGGDGDDKLVADSYAHEIGD